MRLRRAPLPAAASFVLSKSIDLHEVIYRRNDRASRRTGRAMEYLTISSTKKPATSAGLCSTLPFSKIPGAGEGIRTLDPDLGKVVLYH